MGKERDSKAHKISAQVTGPQMPATKAAVSRRRFLEGSMLGLGSALLASSPLSLHAQQLEPFIPAPNSLSQGRGLPAETNKPKVDFTEEMRQTLAVPYNVAIDKSAQSALGVQLGDLAMLNGRTVRVALLLDGYANSQFSNLIMSRQTYRLLGQYNDDRLGLLMARIQDPSQADRVRDELNEMADGQYRAWTKPELREATMRDALSEGILGLILMFLRVIGFFIGVVITWQTLRGAILANIKEFASLRALGVSMGNLRTVIIELSFWVGIAGLIMAGLAMLVLNWLGSLSNIPMGYRVSEVVQTGGLLLLIAVGSGVLTLGALKKGEPADLLR